MKRQTFKYLPAVSVIFLMGLFAPIHLYSDDIFGDIVKNAADKATNKAIEAVPTLLAGGGAGKSDHSKASGTDADQDIQTQAKPHLKKHTTSTPTDEEGASPVTTIPATPTVEESNGFAGFSVSRVHRGSSLWIRCTPGSFPVSALKSVQPYQRFQQDPQAGARFLFDQGMAAVDQGDLEGAKACWRKLQEGGRLPHLTWFSLERLVQEHSDSLDR